MKKLFCLLTIALSVALMVGCGTPTTEVKKDVVDSTEIKKVILDSANKEAVIDTTKKETKCTEKKETKCTIKK